MNDRAAAIEEGSKQIPSWILSSAGASALLITFGYLVEAARDHLLGVAIRENVTLAEYGLAGARFVVNVITLAFRWMGLHPVLAGALALFFVAIGIVTARISKDRLGAVWVHVGVAIILLLLLLKAAFIDVPSALIENVLIERTEPTRVFDATPVLNGQTQKLWQRLICAHASQTSDTDLNCGPPGTARRALELIFLLNVLITVVLCILARNLMEAGARVDGVVRSTLTTTQIVTWTALSVGIVALPYHYGKMVAPTVFSQAIVNFKTSDGKPPGTAVGSAAVAPAESAASGAPSSIAAKSATQPLMSTSNQAPEEELQPRDSRERLREPALLLTANANVLTLYYQRDDLVRQLSRTDVESITLYPPRDVLQVHMDRCLRK